jgi:hypothetical protein
MFHTGEYWYSPDDPRIVIVRGKAALEGNYVLLGTDEDTEAALAESDAGTAWNTLDEAQEAAEWFFDREGPWA